MTYMQRQLLKAFQRTGDLSAEYVIKSYHGSTILSLMKKEFIERKVDKFIITKKGIAELVSIQTQEQQLPE